MAERITKVVRNRERSTIQFPYGDLDDAVEVARAIHNRAGGSCTMADLAAFLDQTVTSGAFRGKVATARTFRVIEGLRSTVNLTAIGNRLIDPRHEAGARADAFLSVPLYARLYENFRGRILPPDEGLENEMVKLGVASKQKDKARQAFQRSAEQAGFFYLGRDRLQRPPESGVTGNEDAGGSGNGDEGGGGGFEDTGHHELIKGLFRMLPEGGGFSPRKQAQWLAAAKVNLALVYGGDDSEEDDHLA